MVFRLGLVIFEGVLDGPGRGLYVYDGTQLHEVVSGVVDSHGPFAVNNSGRVVYNDSSLGVMTVEDYLNPVPVEVLGIGDFLFRAANTGGSPGLEGLNNDGSFAFLYTLADTSRGIALATALYSVATLSQAGLAVLLGLQAAALVLVGGRIRA